ncbi:hypothetical protein JZ751_027146 [Albula glossodonta]|uniref:Kelch domain-containing protein 3 n=1 Tax=Albula glossodonta TaxID=121402 RepID=A0A8T2NFJ8_9TELE|nr:hypothetical protein JZ751_027146 [Albula glossodonta]
MSRWTVHLEGGPRRVNHAAVAVGHRVYSFGGYCSGEDYETLRQIDVHVFNAVSLCWMKLPPVRTSGREHAREVPYMRYGHTAVLLDDTVYIWGGRNDTEGACNVLYAFDVGSHRWSTPAVSGTIPGARDGHSACVLGKTMYIFGGYEQLGTPARWRDFHSATIIGTKMFVFGGRADRFGPFHSNNEIYCNKIQVFDTQTNCWLDCPSTQLLPEGRRSHSAFAFNGELYIFGGYNARLDRHYNDLWKFNPESFSWQKVDPKGKGPCPRRRQCCCMVGDKIILFGGTRVSSSLASLIGRTVRMFLLMSSLSIHRPPHVAMNGEAGVGNRAISRATGSKPERDRSACWDRQLAVGRLCPELPPALFLTRSPGETGAVWQYPLSCDRSAVENPIILCGGPLSSHTLPQQLIRYCVLDGLRAVSHSTAAVVALAWPTSHWLTSVRRLYTLPSLGPIVRLFGTIKLFACYVWLESDVCTFWKNRFLIQP